MDPTRRRLLGLFAVGMALSVVVLAMPAVLDSWPYHVCKNNIEKHYRENPEQHRQHPLLIEFRCSVSAINSNEGFVTALAGVVMLVFTAALYHATQAATDTSAKLLAAAAEANGVARDAARAARDAAEAATTSTRAWILPSGPVVISDVPLSEDKLDKHARVQLRNFGKTPAIVGSLRTKLFLSTNLNPPRQVDRILVGSRAHQIVGAGEPVPDRNDPALDPCCSKCETTVEQWTAVLSDKAWLMLDTLVQYQDVFGGKWETYLRYMYQRHTREMEMLFCKATEAPPSPLDGKLIKLRRTSGPEADFT